MLLQSNNNFYIHENKTKYLFSLHPLIIAYYLANDKQSPDTLQKIKNEYSPQELDIYYQQYLFIKTHFLIDIKKDEVRYGRINGKIVHNSFNNVNQIVFEVTDKCNLKCTYCAFGDFYSGYDKRNHKNLDFNKAKTLIDYFVPIWRKKVEEKIQSNITISFYGGEPLLNFKIIAQIVSYCESLGFQKDFFNYSMTTNGLLINKYRDYLIDKNFRLTVSLDGNKENNSFRLKKTGENSFDDVIANIEQLRQFNDEYFNNNISFISVIHKRNSIQECLYFIKDKFNKTPATAPITTYDIVPEQKLFFDEFLRGSSEGFSSEKEIEELDEDELGKYDIYSFIRKNARHYFYHYFDIYKIGQSLPITPTGTCFPFSRKVYLSVNGKILPCERIHVIHTMGRVSKTKGVLLNFESAANHFNKNIASFKEHCKNCYNRSTCGICALKYSGSPCDEFINMIDFIKIMYINLTLIEKYPHTYNYIKNIITS
jgi:uncharacterized protein